jgi:hypothetical protein
LVDWVEEVEDDMEERETLSVTVRRASELDSAAILALVPRLVDFGPPPWRDTAEMTEADLSVIADALTSKWPFQKELSDFSRL